MNSFLGWVLLGPLYPILRWVFTPPRHVVEVRHVH
jgi:hypothetical protein